MHHQVFNRQQRVTSAVLAILARRLRQRLGAAVNHRVRGRLGRRRGTLHQTCLLVSRFGWLDGLSGCIGSATPCEVGIRVESEKSWRLDGSG